MKKYLVLMFVVVPSLVHAASIKLTWQDNSLTESGFVIERRQGATGAFTKLAEVNANVTTYTDETAVAGSTWCYQVKTQRNTEMSAPSNTACLDIAAPPLPIEGPSNLSVIKVTVEVLQSPVPSGEGKE